MFSVGGSGTSGVTTASGTGCIAGRFSRDKLSWLVIIDRASATKLSMSVSLPALGRQARKPVAAF